MVRPGRDRLSGSVELDESYVGGPQSGKRGRGAEGKVLIIGVVEVRGEGSGRLRLGIIPSATRNALESFLRANVEESSVVRTDGYHGYHHLPEIGYHHRPEISGGRDNPRGVLPRIHRVFSNLKTWLAGTHHGVSEGYLDAYLHEFEFRFNRRRTPMAAFQTLLGLTSQRAPAPRYKGWGRSESAG
jgi:transposase-like protein